MEKASSKACLVFEALNTAPSAQDESVISSDHGNHIDAFGLEFIIAFEVRWQMVYVASGLLPHESLPPILEVRLTVKAPGTEKRTTFLPFQESVDNSVAKLDR